MTSWRLYLYVLKIAEMIFHVMVFHVLSYVCILYDLLWNTIKYILQWLGFLDNISGLQKGKDPNCSQFGMKENFSKMRASFMVQHIFL